MYIDASDNGSASDAQVYNASDLKEGLERNLIMGFPDPEPCPITHKMCLLHPLHFQIPTMLCTGGLSIPLLSLPIPQLIPIPQISLPIPLLSLPIPQLLPMPNVSLPIPLLSLPVPQLLPIPQLSLPIPQLSLPIPQACKGLKPFLKVEAGCGCGWSLVAAAFLLAPLQSGDPPCAPPWGVQLSGVSIVGHSKEYLPGHRS
uniref:Uncharacterized protein n=1 Tax=Laticauda laticaudata TaxID=8630 RepID=A0A8C5RXQ9_LATLA